MAANLEIILLQKVVTAYEAVDVIRSSMSIFGGHGVMEEFSSLPRLFRDAAVNELWEGPRNVLLTQVYRGIKRASEWYAPSELVASILEGSPRDVVEYFSYAIREIMSRTPAVNGDEAMKDAGRWEVFCANLFRAYQEHALAGLSQADIIRE